MYQRGSQTDRRTDRRDSHSLRWGVSDPWKYASSSPVLPFQIHQCDGRTDGTDTGRQQSIVGSTYSEKVSFHVILISKGSGSKVNFSSRRWRPFRFEPLEKNAGIFGRDMVAKFFLKGP